MSRMKKENGLLRFLISAVFFALVLTGCNGTRKYEAVDLSSETASEMSENGADPGGRKHGYRTFRIRRCGRAGARRNCRGTVKRRYREW